MVINTNSAAMNAGRLLGQSFQAQRKSLARLSSGSKIVSPEDDSAGLAQSAKLKNESLRHNAALQILANGNSFLQTKDGFLQKVQKALDRMSELSVLALDATKTNNDQSNYNTEFQTRCIPKLLVTFWTAAASEARRRFGVRPAERSTRTSDPPAAQSAVAAALCRRSPYPSDRSSPTNNFGMHGFRR